MKIVVFIFAFFSVFSIKAQYSYYFAEPLPSANNSVEHVSEKYFGSYTTKDGTLSYNFDETGVTIVSTTIASISKETVRESSKYSVRNGYLFGVEKNDSVPCILEDDFYFFGVRNFDVFVGAGSQNVLCKTASSNEYVLNVYDNGKFLPQQIAFNGRKLEMFNFDYDGEEEGEFDFVTEQEELPLDGLNLILLKPESSDFDRIASHAFANPTEFKRTSR